MDWMVSLTSLVMLLIESFSSLAQWVALFSCLLASAMYSNLSIITTAYGVLVGWFYEYITLLL